MPDMLAGLEQVAALYEKFLLLVNAGCGGEGTAS
jgi:hypothetical protein